MNQVLPLVPDLSWSQFGFECLEAASSDDDDLAFLLQALVRAEAQERRLIARSQAEDGAALRNFYAAAIAKVSVLISEIELSIEATARRPHSSVPLFLAA